ncbi:MAG: ATP-dependent RecD-like DNA helicase [Oscillospiraceae bacterium]|jgi:exodeoxyribonuclease V alpha subunit|nr:ATP-dependent RecD-like DNA helicase [Oscillospiraceae bacterium]
MDETFEQLTVAGTVESVLYKNAANGYIVLTLSANDEMISVNGNLGDIRPGEKLSLTGRFEDHPKYGLQFRARACERTMPATEEELIKYLSSGIIEGLAPKLAVNIVQFFGTETLAALENAETLTTMPGMKLSSAVHIATEYQKVTTFKKLTEFLKEYGISADAAFALWNMYGAAATAMVKENPYILCDRDVGVPFEAADNLAAELGENQNGEQRVLAALTAVLTENLDGGHTCLPEKDLRDIVTTRFDINPTAAEECLLGAVEHSVLAAVGKGDSDKRRIYLPEYLEAEVYIAKRLSDMLKEPTNAEPESIEREIDAAEWTAGIKYAELQKEAIRKCFSHNLFILTGGPGTGKTTALNAVIDICKARKITVCLAAPTGRAAQRISELTTCPAKTIHRLLEVEVADDRSPMTFRRNEDNPLRCGAVIIDEMSMVDVLLFDSLLRAVPRGCKLILVGDSNQLPSVGAGNVLRDLSRSGVVPFVELKEIFRQAAESLIITNAHKIIRGELPDLNVRDKDFFFMRTTTDEETASTALNLVSARLPKAYGISPFDDIQVVCPTKIGPTGTARLNMLLQEALNPADGHKAEAKFFDRVFREGDKVMQVRNDYNIEWVRAGEKGTGIFNGDIGVITEIKRRDGQVMINFDGRAARFQTSQLGEVDLAYAVTIHKTQGSEYDTVVIPLTDIAPRLLYRNLLYTGVTRAKKRLILIGKQETVAVMVERNLKINRYSSLRQLLLKSLSD